MRQQLEGGTGEEKAAWMQLSSTGERDFGKPYRGINNHHVNNSAGREDPQENTAKGDGDQSIIVVPMSYWNTTEENFDIEWLLPFVCHQPDDEIHPARM